GAQPDEGVSKEVLHCGRAGVEADEAAERVAKAAEFDAELYLVSLEVFQCSSDEQLVVAVAVEVAGVDERHAGVNGGKDRGDALDVVGWAVQARHAHAAEAERADDRPGAAELGGG